MTTDPAILALPFGARLALRRALLRAGHRASSYVPPATWGGAGEACRIAGPLFDQQLWCWGRDVVRAPENALQAFGFGRRRPPAGVPGSSRYRLTLAGEGEVVLWAFGLFYGAPDLGGLFLRRYTFAPRVAAQARAPAAWLAGEAEAATVPGSNAERGRVLLLLARTAAWVASYERWIIAHHGLAYRRACIRDWPHAVLTPQQALDAWDALASSCAAMATVTDADPLRSDPPLPPAVARRARESPAIMGH